jgi:hypothetical protein
MLFMSLYTPSAGHDLFPCTVVFTPVSVIAALRFLPLRGRRTGDVEPLVDAGVDRRRGLVLALGNVDLAGVGAVGGVRNGGVEPGSVSCSHNGKYMDTYRLRSSLGVLPVASFSQASAHSRTISMAYFLFLHSPEKANWFSGLPSGIL